MIRILAFSLLLLGLFSNVNAQEDWSKHLKLANTNTEYCKTFYEIMESQKDESNTAYGYYALANMMLAKVNKNPFTKLNYFNKGKSMLEKTISEDQSNVELRFLRFAVQNEVPPILFYFNDLEEDKAILDQYISKNDTPLARRILSYYNMKNIEYLTVSGSIR